MGIGINARQVIIDIYLPEILYLAVGAVLIAGTFL